jgi:hypothetical protein
MSDETISKALGINFIQPIPEKQEAESLKEIRNLRDIFIMTYNNNAIIAKLDTDNLDFFISWNYMTMFPRFKSGWKYFYHKMLFKGLIHKVRT